ncbi:MFS transporter [Nocardia yamanashiensis]|uniref:MFS transporter n=1 Tax=Nocardia yamanashiensis TaxID=209247 RepID=UPI00082F4E0A|nr:MFS transporter [Nocardia yamanashiensis]
MPRTTRITVLLLFAAWVVDYIDRIVINFALPAIGDDLGLDHTRQGLLVSVFFLAYAGMQVPGGLLADRFGALTVGGIGLLAWSVFTGLTALAWSFSVLLAMRFLFGLVQGVFPAAALKALSERTAPEQRTTASGWVNSSNAVGILFASVIAAVLLPAAGWRVMFAVISLLGVAVVLAWRRWMPEPLPHNELAAPLLDPAARRAVLRSPALLGFAAMFFGYDVLVWGVTAWSPTYLHEVRGIEMSVIAWASLPSTAAGAVGVVLGARLSDRLGGRARLIVAPAMTVVVALLFLLPRVQSFPLFIVTASVMGLVASLCYMPAFAVPLRALPSSFLGVATGVIIFGGQLAGVLSPLAFGVVTDHVSYTTAFEVMALGPLVAIVAAFLVPQSAEAFRAAVTARTPLPADAIPATAKEITS